MNKTLSFRFFVITFFCLLSLAIKSENSCYTPISSAPKSADPSVPVTILREEAVDPDYRTDVLFIKI